MAFGHENTQQSFKPGPSPPPLPWPPVFPPLPPPDATKTESMRMAPSLQPVPAAWSESRPRRFGTRIANKLNAVDDSSTAYKTDLKPPFSAAAQRYYHQHQYFPQPGMKSPIAEKLTGENYEKKAECMTKASPYASLEDTSTKDDRWTSAKSPQVSALIEEYSPKNAPNQTGRTIWSVTPAELTELAKGISAMKKESAEPVRQLSYAEASKRNLPGFIESRASAKTEALEVEQPVRTFKKYYGLPITPPYESSNRWDTNHAAKLEEKKYPFKNPTGLNSDNKPSEGLNYSQIFGLSANTPTFYPRQATDTNDFIQLLKASLASKKVAPHMDWWPGDWKCTSCGESICLHELC